MANDSIKLCTNVLYISYTALIRVMNFAAAHIVPFWQSYHLLGTAFINLIEDQQKETGVQFCCSHFQIQDYQVATTSTDKALCRKKQADSIQNLSHTPCSLCPSQCGPHSSKCQDARVATTQPSVMQDREHNYPCDTEMGKEWLIEKSSSFALCLWFWVKNLYLTCPSQDQVQMWCATVKPRGQPRCPSSPLFWFLQESRSRRPSPLAAC